jgi:L-rhamnose mutarotase
VTMSSTSSADHALKRFAFVHRRHEDAAEVDGYAHRGIWPEMRDMHKLVGIVEYSILRETASFYHLQSTGL